MVTNFPAPTKRSPLRPIVLLVFDGFGLSPIANDNPIAMAETPTLDLIKQSYPGAALAAAGINVGLAWGEFGNSEVGHRTLGGGVVLYQNLPRISLSIEDGSFFKNEAFLKAAKHVKKNKSKLHVMGLLGNGGIHSHTDHLKALIKFAAQQKLEVYLHLFTDGIDAPPRSDTEFLTEIEQTIKEQRTGKIATLVGRHFSMDREGKWDKTEKTYRLLALGEGAQAKSARAALKAAHKESISDEQVPPTVIMEGNEPVGLISEGDALIYINFRNDRERQLTESIALPSFDKFERGKRVKDLLFVTMVEYEEALPVEIAFPPEHIEHPLARVISDAGLKQFHVAETDKYAHVTFFFNGGVEKAYKGEKRELVPSKHVSSYAKTPEMSAEKITAQLEKAISSGKYDFIVANYANSDMVGHTGNLKATTKAIEVLDVQTKRVMDATLAAGGALLITADHGNGEEVINAATGEIDKQHSANAVPFHLIAERYKLAQEKSEEDILAYFNPPAGVLADVAPTVLELMGLKKHPNMTGLSLLNVIQ